MLYRLSGIENESDDEDDKGHNDPLPDFDPRSNNETFGEWQSPFNLSEFQPNQFFPNWDDSSSTTTNHDNNHERTEVTSNGHHHGTDF